MDQIAQETRLKKSVTAYRRNLEEDGSSWFKYRTVIYRKDGKPLREIVYTEEGKERAVILYNYTPKGDIESKETLYPATEKSERYVYHYDRNGNEVEQVKFQNGKLYDRCTHYFNREGLETESVHFDEENVAFERDVYEYDNQGRRIKLIHINEDGETEYETMYEYDEHDRVAREISNKIAERTAEMTRYEYDDNDNRVYSETVGLSGEVTGTVRVSYDDNGNAFRYVSETFGIAPSKMVNQVAYDDEGRPTVNEYYDVLLSKLVLREAVKYNVDGDMTEEELYELDTDTEDETHYILQMAYEYYV
jgi:hypothetical protein